MMSVNADLHNHFRTREMMKGLLMPVLRTAAMRLGRPFVLGVIDFENFGPKSRFAQLAEQAEPYGRNLGNAYHIIDGNPQIPDVALLVKGEEVPTEQGHLLVLGLAKNVHLEGGKPLQYTIMQAIEQRGIIIADHPYSPHGGLGPYLDKHLGLLDHFDGWEFHNGEAAACRGANQKAKARYQELVRDFPQLGAIAGSDGHSIYEIGTSYTPMSMPDFSRLNSPLDVSDALRRAVRISRPEDSRTHNSYFGALDHLIDLKASHIAGKFGVKL